MSNTNELNDLIGTPSYGGERRFENWKLEDNKPPVVVRILPPLKRNGRTSPNSIYVPLVFGWNGADAKDPSKKRYRPFLSLEERDFRRNNMIVTDDAAGRLIADNKKKFEQLSGQAKAKNLSPAATEKDPEIGAEWKRLKDWLYEHSINGKNNITCMDQSGKYGILKINHTCKKALEAEVARLRKDGYDPFGVQGVWFEFSRPDRGGRTDTVRAVRESTIVNGQKMDFVKTHDLTRETLQAAIESLPDLEEMRESYRLTQDQIERMVNGSGDPTEIDAIWSEKREAQAQAAAQAVPTSTVTVPTVAVPAPVPQVTQKITVTSVASAPKPAATVTPPATPTIDPTKASDAEWDALFDSSAPSN